MELFGKKTKNLIANNEPKENVPRPPTIAPTLIDASEIQSFKELGLCNWICKATAAMGYKRPTPIQSNCIPAIVSGRNVLGCAVTGNAIYLNTMSLYHIANVEC